MKKLKMKQKKIKKRKRELKEKIVYETDKYAYNFKQIETIRSFSKNIFSRKSFLDGADKDQNSLLN